MWTPFLEILPFFGQRFYQFKAGFVSHKQLILLMCYVWHTFDEIFYRFFLMCKHSMKNL